MLGVERLRPLVRPPTEGRTMDNESARELLYNFQEAAHRAIRAAVWAEAFLVEGGEATWDAVKSASDTAVTVQHFASQVEKLLDQYDDITPF